jgi:Homeodomain-like domain
MHDLDVRHRALALAADGVTDGRIAVELGVPRTTVRDWRSQPYRRRWSERCPRCWRHVRDMRFSASDYAMLLGLYLGDGHISRVGRTFRLRLSLDAAYPHVVAEARALLACCMPHQRSGVTRADRGATVIPWIYSSHLPCLFPQHGLGKKHERAIVLESWQQAQVDAAPWALLRGLLWSDGCSFVNRTGRYSYLSFDFCNRSSEILGLFAATCDAVGVRYRQYEHRIRINRRASVLLVEANVGLKC